MGKIKLTLSAELTSLVFLHLHSLFLLHLHMYISNIKFLFCLCSEEINFLLMCCDTNHDGKIDYVEFTDRFHDPAKEIGFNLAVLLTNLSEHMPNEPR